MRKGYFITIEGGEGAGKTTVFNELEKRIRQKGHQVVRTRELEVFSWQNKFVTYSFIQKTLIWMIVQKHFSMPLLEGSI